MFDVILEGYRKAAESTMKVQQDMLRSWTGQMFGGQGLGFPWTAAPISGSSLPGGDWLEQLSAAQKKWGEAVTEMLNKHRESLDAQYRAGIETIENAFKLGEAKDPQQFRRLTEELWKQSFECLKTVAESQMRDVQTAMQKWYDIACKTASGMKA